MKRVIFRREARADALEAYHWYEAQDAGLGSDFRNELSAAVQRIRESPAAYRVLHRDTRRARLRRFPYGVVQRRNRCRRGATHQASSEEMEAADVMRAEVPTAALSVEYEIEDRVIRLFAGTRGYRACR